MTNLFIVIELVGVVAAMIYFACALQNEVQDTMPKTIPPKPPKPLTLSNHDDLDDLLNAAFDTIFKDTIFKGPMAPSTLFASGPGGISAFPHGGNGWAGGGGSSGYVQVIMTTTDVAPISFDEIPKAGTKFGEIIGWRAWKLERITLLPHDAVSVTVLCPPEWRLKSCYIDHFWEPGATETGDPRMHGVHAWKSMTDAVNYATEWNDPCYNSPPALLVVGSLALWGEVVEHERGYRAQFARPRSFDLVAGYTMRGLRDPRGEHYMTSERAHGVMAEPILAELRERYLKKEG